MSTEVASTRLPIDMLREIDRQASARGLRRSVYLAHLIERGTARDTSTAQSADLAGLQGSVMDALHALHDGQKIASQGLRDILTALQARASQPVVRPDSSTSPLIERLAFSTFFSEALLKRVSALLYRNPGELAQVVREAREQATAEARMWRERNDEAGASGKDLP